MSYSIIILDKHSQASVDLADKRKPIVNNTQSLDPQNGLKIIQSQGGLKMDQSEARFSDQSGTR